ncbi:hypothetical protein H310_12505 [Aphanomyces invadans]|uniref:DDE Tnp4 domain-containing protein n=1 Tax=Aphanomyces invadans TaxID=157072 RepID=A0A024THK6_9STRA|nr:hypothetical protein H310_12505 [Aphanomyces invadans]ETV93454.1 hypothetical protein H310_12505 [Aphanomyces invadans]|eukprot:XP_008877796.1 hypothetical protein H310_12505 [Aphanomyces invadans]
MYGFKVEASVSPDGRLVDMSEPHLGSVADLTILRYRIDNHRHALTKSAEELLVPDHGEQAQDHPDMWVMLLDKSYYGAAADLRAIHPKKNPPRGLLDQDNIARNRRVSSDTVLVENIFGRVCSLWKISYSTIAWNQGVYDEIQRHSFTVCGIVLFLPVMMQWPEPTQRSVLKCSESPVIVECNAYALSRGRGNF